jgi:AraC family transcriptional regulator
MEAFQSGVAYEGTGDFRPAPADPSPRRAVRRAIEFIQANLAGSIHLEDIATAASLSAFHFSRIFKRTTGMTPLRYVTRMRVELVKKLLRESQMSVATIADATGFSDQSHMSKIFKRLTGTTPRTFRISTHTPLQR